MIYIDVFLITEFISRDLGSTLDFSPLGSLQANFSVVSLPDKINQINGC